MPLRAVTRAARVSAAAPNAAAPFGGAHAASTRLAAVFWHTQGSGKSLSMVFFTQKVLRKLPGNWTFLVVTDRDELGEQIYKTSQNEIPDLAAKSVNIRPHRERMVKEDLDEKFKDPDSDFRLAFVCAMWITGFDVPTCSTICLDKPMRNHTLMQTIARANRVAPGKVSGLIVDYAGVFGV